ncbi:universal stress protein [Rhodobacteraceae bacterium F11138]|nr:universal stress protein [Rhodobacteraceae bacterium F11138]
MPAVRILAAIDRFPEDDAVLLRGIEIAERQGVALTIIHVVDLPVHAASAALITPFRGQAEVAARGRIEAALRRHGIASAEVQIRIETGAPADRLIEICSDLEPTLVVMRAHQKPWIVWKLLGSTSEKVVAAGCAPVLVVKPTIGKPYERVLLAIDGAETAPTVLPFVTGLLPETSVHMIQAVAITPQFEQAMLRVGLARCDLTAHQDVLAQHAQARLASLAADLPAGVTWQVLRGEPAQELARATHAPDVDLIALGPTRIGLLKRVFIGGVTRRLLRDAGCDVLIARPAGAVLPDVITRRDPTAVQTAST